jgi:arsenite-transporting ATPase
VGKTTCAAAAAVASAAAGHRTLIISTDPASSLGDVFEVPLSSAPRRIPLGRGVLHGVEINAAHALARWLAGRRGAFERIALRGTWLDRADVSQLLRLSVPGADELAAVIELIRFEQSSRYDRIVVDTAPTGHTLRMLMLPDGLRMLARVFDAMQLKHRIVVEALRGSWAPDEDDALIEEMDRDGRRWHALLRDQSQVRVSWVTLPESMAVEETVDAAAALARDGIPLSDVIVNHLTPAPGRPCDWCEARQVLETKALRELRARLPSISFRGVSDRIREPRGARDLASIGRELAASPLALRRGTGRRSRRWRTAAGPAPSSIDATIAGDHTRLIMFGGKGGVGKTTCAAAAALSLASRSGARLLLLSTDPAHSLGDVLRTPLSDVPVTVPGGPPNLLVRELDAARQFRRTRMKYASAIDALFDRLIRGGSGSVQVDAVHDRRVMHGLIDLAPPGMDELAAVAGVADEIDSEQTDMVIMDTAPSGHALRLLGAPAMVQEWTRALMAILLKYQPVVGLGELGRALLQMSQALGRLRALLADRRRTAFVVVTRAAALPRVETVRLLRRLRALRVHAPLVIVNAVGRGTCPRCRAAAKQQRREMVRLETSGPRTLPLVTAAAELPPPTGAAALARWHDGWQFRRRPRAISSKRIS